MGAGQGRVVRSVNLFGDPMVRLLILAFGLALLLPVAGPARGAALTIANMAVFALFLLNGLRLPRRDVLAGLADWKFHGTLVFFVFGLMAALGLATSHLAGAVLTPTLALGFLYLGALPSTVQSATSYTTLAGGSIAHAVVAAAVLNVLGVFVTAPLFAAAGGGQAVATGSDILVKVATILLLPFLLGQVLQPRFGAFVRSRDAPFKRLDQVAIALAVYVAMSGAVADGVIARIAWREWAVLLALVAGMFAAAAAAAWLVGGRAAASRPARIAFLFSGSQKSIAMGAPLATLLFPTEVAGLVLLPVLAYHFLQLVAAAPLAARLRGQAES